MRLINLTTFELEEYYGNVPQYAILSHRWGKEELGFQDWTKYSQSTDRKTWKGRGIAKILGARKQAIQDGYHYLWCDTCCIDKSSSAELSENINSMFNYYADAAVCYAYMRDVPELGEGGASEQMKKFEASRWFTRGWTLQELLAPKKVVFFAKDWSLIGTRGKLVTRISNITGIATRFILRRTQDPAVPPPLFAAGVATKMSWLSRRETTRVEDMAYCMLGIFDINMPLLYGEGHKAFTRLQEEIIRVSNDQSIFCWRWDEKFVPHNWVSILSPSPRAFDQSADYKAYRLIEDGDEYKTLMSQLTYSLTNIGLSINLPVVPWFGGFLAVLEAYSDNVQLTIPLDKPVGRTYTRMPFPPSPAPIGWYSSPPEIRSLYIKTNTVRHNRSLGQQQQSRSLPGQYPSEAWVLPTLGRNKTPFSHSKVSTWSPRSIPEVAPSRASTGLLVLTPIPRQTSGNDMGPLQVYTNMFGGIMGIYYESYGVLYLVYFGLAYGSSATAASSQPHFLCKIADTIHTSNVDEVYENYCKLHQGNLESLIIGRVKSKKTVDVGKTSQTLEHGVPGYPDLKLEVVIAGSYSDMNDPEKNACRYWMVANSRILRSSSGEDETNVGKVIFHLGAGAPVCSFQLDEDE